MGEGLTRKEEGETDGDGTAEADHAGHERRIPRRVVTPLIAGFELEWMAREVLEDYPTPVGTAKDGMPALGGVALGLSAESAPGLAGAAKRPGV